MSQVKTLHVRCHTTILKQGTWLVATDKGVRIFSPGTYSYVIRERWINTQGDVPWMTNYFLVETDMGLRVVCDLLLSTEGR